MGNQRHWTVREANAVLPYVGRKLDRLQELLALMEMDDAEEGYAIASVETGGGWPGRSAAAAAVEVALIMQRLDDLGIVIRDLDQGLVDFPAFRDGQEVYLC